MRDRVNRTVSLLFYIRVNCTHPNRVEVSDTKPGIPKPVAAGNRLPLRVRYSSMAILFFRVNCTHPNRVEVKETKKTMLKL